MLPNYCKSHLFCISRLRMKCQIVLLPGEVGMKARIAEIAFEFWRVAFFPLPAARVFGRGVNLFQRQLLDLVGCLAVLPSDVRNQAVSTRLLLLNGFESILTSRGSIFNKNLRFKTIPLNRTDIRTVVLGEPPPHVSVCPLAPQKLFRKFRILCCHGRFFRTFRHGRPVCAASNASHSTIFANIDHIQSHRDRNVVCSGANRAKFLRFFYSNQDHSNSFQPMKFLTKSLNRNFFQTNIIFEVLSCSFELLRLRSHDSA